MNGKTYLSNYNQKGMGDLSGTVSTVVNIGIIGLAIYGGISLYKNHKKKKRK